MGNIGGWELVLIFLVVLLVFGAKRIPEIARGLGKGIREFKDATANIKQELTMEDESRKVGAPRQGTAMPRQDPYYYQQSTPPPAPPQEAPQQQPQAPAQPSEQKTHTPE